MLKQKADIDPYDTHDMFDRFLCILTPNLISTINSKILYLVDTLLVLILVPKNADIIEDMSRVSVSQPGVAA